MYTISVNDGVKSLQIIFVRMPTSLRQSYPLVIIVVTLSFFGLSGVVNAQTSDTTAPSKPTGFAATAVSSSQINLSWNPSTDNVAVTSYRLVRCQGASCTNFQLVATISGTTYSDTGLVAATTYRYKVRAVDAGGNVSPYTAKKNATTQTATSDTTPPTVSITAPASGITVTQGTIVTVSADAFDNVGVTSVDFKVDGATFFTDTVSPYSFSWDTADVSTGTHTLTAVAADAVGNTTTSGGVTMTVSDISSSVKAFPTAEGFGANSVGGRGGVVYEVTNLNDSGAESLRNCIIASGPRTCVFRIGGTISLNSQLNIRNPFLTIAGQTAPGGGIAIRMNPAWTGRKKMIEVNAPNVIIRHIRLRPGKLNPGINVSSHKAIMIGTDVSEVYNVILDHVSATWAIDTNVETGSAVHDITIQNSIISEGLNNAGHEEGLHAMAMNFYVGGKNQAANVRMSLHHNLLSHVKYRVPQISTLNGMVEVINNVVYHTTRQGMNINCVAHDFLGDSKTRWVKNYSLRIPIEDIDPDTGRLIPLSEINFPDGNGCLPGAQAHARGNIGPTRNNDSLSDDLSIDPPARSRWTSDPTLGGTFPYPDIRVTEDASADSTLDKVSGTGAFAGTQMVGATVPRRDPVDTRIVSQLTTYLANPSDPNTVPVPGGLNDGLLDDPAQVGGYPTLAAGTPPTDTDQDGMPDTWESSHGLNPDNVSDGAQTAANGYTNLENYLNELAGDAAPG